ncbi:MAG: hypothetical protein K2M12_07785, partial [Muribaculaceae bacterium]|nr:hypothetical protein [Muribaculaceae bacterium]
VWACDDDPEVYGDFSLKPELKVGAAMVSKNTGAEYQLVVAREYDSTYRYSYNVYDTLKDETGRPILDNGGKLQITTSEAYYYSKRTGHIVEFEKIMFPSYEAIEFDTIRLDIVSNANWRAPMGKAVNWYNNVGNTEKGGGDGTFSFSIKRFNNEVSKNIVEQEIFTSDSLTMYRFTFGHYGLKYKGE